MNRLNLDFETRSAIDLRKVGAYRYAEDPSTGILIVGLSGERMNFPDTPLHRLIARVLRQKPTVPVVTTTDVIYDIECYPNIFTIVIYSPRKEQYFTFEISERRNEMPEINKIISRLGQRGHRMVGFNNMGYDYPVLHALINFHKGNPRAEWFELCTAARKKSDEIINGDHHDRFKHLIWDNNQFCQQVDLFKIHHFDNVARSTSLKVLQFNMRSESIEDLPFDPNQAVDPPNFDDLILYNRHDVQETYRFYLETLEAIDFREKLSEKNGVNFINANDTKIGKTIFQMELEKQMGKGTCFYYTPEGERKPRQTKRKRIAVKDVILPCARFERKEFNLVKEWMRKQVLVDVTKDVFTGIAEDDIGELIDHCDTKKIKGKIKSLNCIVDGFGFVFGTGGLHGCIDSATVESCDRKVIVDLDVTSYYPSLAIVNGIYPEHLGPEFCLIYKRLKEQRMTYKKGTPENAALKLALNGVYGDSNNKYSPFYDPQYTMAITINGQLLLCMLAEKLMSIEGVEMIQANTDGVTIRIDRDRIAEMEEVCREWEGITKLELESARYRRMFIRDVNNYIAEYEDGKLKRKGAYEYELDWHKNFSCLVVQKAAEAHLIHGVNIEEFIRNHDDPYDFYLRAKVPRSSRLVIRHRLTDEKTMEKSLRNITRYYVSNDGGQLVKIMPPLPKKPDKEREISVNKGWNVTVHDVIAFMVDINYKFYVSETKKLVHPLVQGFSP